MLKASTAPVVFCILKIFVFLPPQHLTPINCSLIWLNILILSLGIISPQMFFSAPIPWLLVLHLLNSSHQVVLSLLFPSPQLNLSDIHSPAVHFPSKSSAQEHGQFLAVSKHPSCLHFFSLAHLRFHDPSFNIIIIYKHHPLPSPSSSFILQWQNSGL